MVVELLHEFLAENGERVLERSRANLVKRFAPRATEDELRTGLPFFLEHLMGALRSSTESFVPTGEPARHGAELLEKGFTVARAVHDYVGLCQAITEVADETDAAISAAEYTTLFRCLDEAIAQAVVEYTRRREQENTEVETERLGALSHEFRNALGVAMLSFETLRGGGVGFAGSTAALLERSLRRMASLVETSIAHVRLESGKHVSNRVSLRELVEDLEVGASMEAAALGLTLAVRPVAPDVDVAADRQLLTAAVGNLLQNAFKFTRAHGGVSLTTSWDADFVVMEVADECGGLKPGDAEALFQPFEQRGADRTGLGLGLSISRKSIEADGGTLSVRNVPGFGCIFSVKFPRLYATP